MAVKFTRTVAGLRQELSFDELADMLTRMSCHVGSIGSKYHEGRSNAYETAAALLRSFKVEEYDDARN